MKLSEAILLGSSMVPEGCGYDSCALGAAAAAIGRNIHVDSNIKFELVQTVVEEVWPFLKEPVQHPIRPTQQIARITIGELNGWVDRKGYWTRKQIADWVATIEPQEVTQVEEPSHEPTRQPA